MPGQVFVDSEDAPPTQASAAALTDYYFPSASGIECLGADHLIFLLSASNAEVLSAAVIEYSNNPAAGWVTHTVAAMTTSSSTNLLAALNAGGASAIGYRAASNKGTISIPMKYARLKATVGANAITNLRVETYVVAPASIGASTT